jgi:GNAT superfamily N-acetyltransferase
MPLVDLGPATEETGLVDLGPAENVSRETSIPQVGVLDTNTLMADGFDMEKHIGPEKSAQLDLVGDKDKALDDLKVSAFLQNMGVQQDNINAADIALKAQMENTESGFFDSIKEGWDNNQIQLQIAGIRLSERNGGISPDIAQKQVDSLKAKIRETKSTGVSSWVKSAANMAPMMLDTSSSGAKYGLAAGGTAALIALAGGQAGPQVALPEEVVTVPGAALTFGGIGFSYGSSKRSMEIQSGLMYDELMTMTDANGNKIDPAIAGPIADSVGAINGMLELVQIGDIIKTIPGGKKLIARAQRATINNLVKRKSIQSVLFNGATKYAGHIGVETGTEVIQEADNVIFGELAKNISNELDKTGFAPAAKADIAKRLLDTAVESAKAFSLIALPGNVVQTGGEALSVKKPTTKPTRGQPAAVPAQQVVPGTEPVERISRVMASEKIIPRLDVDSLGKTLVDEPIELPARKKKETPAIFEGVKLKSGENYIKLPDNIGSVSVNYSPKSNVLYLGAIEVYEDYQGKGIGTKYLDKLKTLADKIGASIEVEVIGNNNADSKNAVRMYKFYHDRGFSGSESMSDMQTRILTYTPKEIDSNKSNVEKIKEYVKLSPEEELQLQQSEATLRAEEPFTITPELYIGNVTQRAKEVLGESFGVDPEQIQGFHEGAWPTKRTKITLKMDEARGLLTHMETSLQSRVDNNQLNTDSDLARANADWGDIKELRKKLGLPKTLRPFRVIRETGSRVVTIENTRERINKTTKSGAQDIVKMTEIDRLDNVIRRVAKAAKEGWSGGKKEAKETFALLQYLRKQKQLRDKLVKNIRKEPNEKVNFFYREAIQGLQNAIDWNVKTEGKKQKKETLREFISRNPDKADEIPAKLMETLSKKDVNNLSYGDLLAMNEEINRLKQLGELKSDSIRAERARAIEKEASDMAAIINKAPVGFIQKALKGIGQEKIAQVERAFSLRPGRIFDMLDGGKDFAGRIYTFFYGHTNEDYNTELLNTEQRQEGMKRRQAELGISMDGLLQKRTVGDFILTVDEMIHVYIGWKNAKSRATMMYGGGEIASSKDYMLVDDALYNQIVDHLTENEMIWGDTIISEYAQNSYDRLRNTVIAAENRDMGKEDNYTPIQVIREDIVSAEQELLDELALRHYFRQDGPHKGMTIKRKDIPAEFRRPMKLGATKQWFQAVRKQEHYINNALHIKDMQAIMKKDEFRKAIVDKFGQPIFDTMSHFIKMTANPDYYKSYNDIENLSKVLRRHTAIAYIAFRIPSMLNQLTGIMSFWTNSSFGDLLSSAMESAMRPMETYEKAKLAHPQISHQSIEREMEEMQIADNTAYERIIAKVGNAGMFGIASLDRAIRVIGINAVYNKAIRDGLSPKEASDKAAKTTLMTQEASTPKDLARLYSTHEFLNWFTMFTNQLNQIYNITTYDIPTAWRNKNYREASRSAISLATMAMMIWMIQNKDIPDEPEDALQAVGEQTVGSIPLLGSYILSGMKGWNASAPAPLEQAAKAGMAVMKLDDDPDKALQKLLEPISVLSGFPYQSAKEAYKFIEENE